MIVPAPGLTFRLLDGHAADERGDADLLALLAEYGSPSDRPSDRGTAGGADGGAGEHARQLRVWRRQPGFALAEAMHGGFVVGYATGMPLRPSTSWWKEVTSPLPPDVTDEYRGRTFAVTTLLVRAAWRRQGIGTGLHRLLLAGRAEERAALTLPPGASAAQAALRAWGWTRAARTRTADGVADIYLLSPVMGRVVAKS